MAQNDSTAAGNGSGGAIFLVIALAALAVVWVGAELAEETGATMTRRQATRPAQGSPGARKGLPHGHPAG